MSKLNGEIRESDIQSAICDYLAIKRFFFWRQNNTPIYDPIRKLFRKFPKYAIKGLPDIQIIHKGKTIFLEVKKKGMYQSNEQKEFEKSAKKNGADYFVVKSLEEAIKSLSDILSHG